MATKTLVTFTDGVNTSVPFVVYVTEPLKGPVTVEVKRTTSVNPATGIEQEQDVISGANLVKSNEVEWFTQFEEWLDEDRKGVVQPFEDEDPADVLKRVRARRKSLGL